MFPEGFDGDGAAAAIAARIALASSVDPSPLAPNGGSVTLMNGLVPGTESSFSPVLRSGLRGLAQCPRRLSRQPLPPRRLSAPGGSGLLIRRASTRWFYVAFQLYNTTSEKLKLRCI